MVLTSTTTKNTFSGDGSTLTPFAVTIPYYAQSNLIVKVGGVTKTLTTHYTIANGSLTASGYYSGGTLSFTAGNAPPVGSGNIIITRRIPKVQSLDFSTLNTFDPDQIETVLDKAAMMVQDATQALEDAVSDTAADLTAEFQDFLDACEAAQTAAELAEAHAETAEVAAELAETNAETAATSATASAAAASLSASSASAIAAGSLSPLASVSGNFTATNKSLQWVDDGAQITPFTPGFGKGAMFINRVQPPVLGITFVYSANTINGFASNVTIRQPGAIYLVCPNDTTFRVMKDPLLFFLALADRAQIVEKTDNYTLEEDDDGVVFTISADKTLTLHNVTASAHKKLIKNSAASTGNLTITRAGSATINGPAGSVTSFQYVFPGQHGFIQANGTNWELYI